jgi:hypothetical protein
VWSGEGGNETRKEEQKGRQKGRIERGERERGTKRKTENSEWMGGKK